MKYEVIIGLEVHVQLQTASKLFARDSATFGAPPNSHISPITMGHPGTLPFINKKAIGYAVKMGLALNCPIRQHHYFDRKNYFYPDLPKGYQVTQDNAPICGAGYLEVETEAGKRKVRIHHIHMEEDAGKSIHDQHAKYSMIDLNRAGVPLVEIVTEPDMRSADEAATFLNEIRQIIQYLGISDGNMEEGSLRCDCNISIREKGTTEYNPRAEIKNMNSIKFVKKAIGYEFNRQVQLMERGETIKQQTRGFDPQKGITLAQRDKEDAHDYRYFPEPDLPLLHITDQELAQIIAEQPELASAKKQRYQKELGLSAYDTKVLTDEREIALYFEELLPLVKDAKTAANWISNTVKSFLNDQKLTISEFSLSPPKLAELIQLVTDGKINQQSAAQKLLPAFAKQPEAEAVQLAEQLNLLMDDSGDALATIIDEVIAAHPNELKAYQNGKKKLFGMFMGEVMKAAKGKANPQQLKQLLTQKLNV